MDASGIDWYFSHMMDHSSIPAFNLFGETSLFPDVVHCERVLDRAGPREWVIAAHRHGEMSQVVHIEAGAARVRLDDTVTHIGEGQYLFVPPQIVHGFEFSKGTEGVVLSFPSPIVSRLAPQTEALTMWLNAPQAGVVSAELEQFISLLVDTYASSGRFRTQRLVALSHILLASLAEEGVAGNQVVQHAGRQMQRLDLLISTHLGKGWSARDYASALAVTTGHLNRIVRNSTGGSLTAYLETAVMTEACRHLTFTKLPIAEVGYLLGYRDPAYFSRRFRARMRETPTSYRTRVARG